MGYLLHNILSHPQSPDFPNGKPLIAHLERVTDNALKKYKGPRKYKYIVEAIGLLHDIGKANPNFQEYLKDPKPFKKQGKFKDHSYISAVILLILLKKNLTDRIDYAIFLSTILIAKHHGNLPDFTTRPLHEESLKSITSFFHEQPKIAKIFIDRANKILNYFKNRLPIVHAKLNFDDFCKKNIHAVNRYIPAIIKNYLNNQDKLEIFIMAQYIFSCIIEGDKRDAGDNNEINVDKDLKILGSKYFAQKLESYYQRNNKSSIAKDSLNEIRDTIKNSCITKTLKLVKQGKRIFQIVAPTGSGKTLTFLSVTSEIKKYCKDKNYKTIYALPYLSITDQITSICKTIFEDKIHQELVHRIDSANTNNFSSSQDDIYDLDKETEQLKEYFAEEIFDHGFIVTTFVKLFETLLSNRNKTLLRLNNFSQSIILIDEIQALPPRSYTFLIAYLSKFAELFDSYVVIGSATQPKFEFAAEQQFVNNLTQKLKITDLFPNYEVPSNLLSDYQKFYQDSNFNRYKLTADLKNKDVSELVKSILRHDSSVMIVLNTKNSSNAVFKLLADKIKENETIYLLNTLQTLRDRRIKLDEIKEKLKSGNKVILVSTQLIEAGIDISFPVVYRDFAPLPSIIQVAGRCNRNFEINMGSVHLINLMNQGGKTFSDFVYEEDLLQITRQIFNGVDNILEKDLLPYQNKFFHSLNNNLHFGKYKLFKSDQMDNDYYLDTAVYNFEYDKIGQFRLIDQDKGEKFSFFIIQNDKDLQDWNSYVELSEKNPFSAGFSLKIKIEEHRKAISDREVQVPVSYYKQRSINLRELFDSQSVLGVCPFDIRDNIGGYSLEEGFNLNNYKDDFII